MINIKKLFVMLTLIILLGGIASVSATNDTNNDKISYKSSEIIKSNHVNNNNLDNFKSNNISDKSINTDNTKNIQNVSKNLLKQDTSKNTLKSEPIYNVNIQLHRSQKCINKKC